ncbi:MAG: PorV/PorQ family protein [Calditrichia bacterium]
MDVQKIRRQGWLILLATLLSFSPVFTQNNTGAQFLQMEIGSRAQALGGAYTAMGNSANGLYYNPGGMAFSTDRELMLYHAQWFSDITIENVTLVLPMNGKLTLASGISFLRMPDMQRYDVDPLTGDPVEDGNFNAYNLLFTSGLSMKFSENFAFGFNVKFLQEALESVRANGFAADVGVLMRLYDRRLQLGFAAQNLGPAITYESQNSALPQTFRAGMAYRIGFPGSLLAVDVVKVKDQPVRVRPGVEFNMGERLWLRSGYQASASEGNGLTAGFGIKLIEDHQINYSYAPYGDLGDTHRAEVVLNLGTPDALQYSQQVNAVRTTSANRAKSTINNDVAQASLELLSESGQVLARQPLTAPYSLELQDIGDNKMKLVWQEHPDPAAHYHLYARPVGSENWVRVSREPIASNYQLFTQKRDDLHLFLAVTVVVGEEESPKSIPIEFKTR